MSYLREFFRSMTGRLFVWLTLGMASAALIATVITNLYSSREFERQLAERTADLLQG
jgi:heme exporter protein D